MLRAEAVARKQKEPSRVLDQIDLEKLAEILAGKAAPPSEGSA
jgi:hypothetical protein